jgi:hypothetical protein
MSENITPKVIRSRFKKSIGDIIEGKWKITAVKVVAPPQPGNPPFVLPRLGIYDYEVEPTSEMRLIQHARNVVQNRTNRQLGAIVDQIKNGNPSVESVLFAADYVLNRDAKETRVIDRTERAMVSFRRIQSR